MLSMVSPWVTKIIRLSYFKGIFNLKIKIRVNISLSFSLFFYKSKLQRNYSKGLIIISTLMELRIRETKNFLYNKYILKGIH